MRDKPLTLFILVGAIIVYLHLSSRKSGGRTGTVEAPGSGLPPRYFPPREEASVTLPAETSQWVNPEQAASWDAFLQRHPGWLGGNFTPGQRERLGQLGPSGRP